MKKYCLILLLLLLYPACSILPPHIPYYEDVKPAIVINCENEMGQAFSGSFVADYIKFNTLEQNFQIVAVPYEYPYADHTKPLTSMLYYSLSAGKRISYSSKEDKYAFELIRKRNKPLNERYIKYCEKNGYDDSFEINDIRSEFLSIYIEGEPTITADKTLFGKPAGEDLSEFFLFYERFNKVRLYGEDYQMVGIISKNERTLFSKSEFFEKGRLLPGSIGIFTTCVPQEVNTEYDSPSGLYKNQYHGEDNIVHVSFMFPARYEQYWDYCRRLYSNPTAKLNVKDITVHIKIPFVLKNK